jgi:predicted nucleotidyltransferase
MARTNTVTNEQALELARQYRQALAQIGIPVADMLLFGSRAKNTARPDSDIDVAVVSPAFGRDYHDELGQLLRCREHVSLLIEPHPFHPADLQNRWSSLAQEIRTHGIQIPKE